MAGRRRRGNDGEAHDRLAQPVGRLPARKRPLRELRELLKETRERVGRGTIEVAGTREHFANDLAAGRGQSGERDVASRDFWGEAEEPPHEGA